MLYLTQLEGGRKRKQLQDAPQLRKITIQWHGLYKWKIPCLFTKLPIIASLDWSKLVMSGFIESQLSKVFKLGRLSTVGFKLSFGSPLHKG